MEAGRRTEMRPVATAGTRGRAVARGSGACYSEHMGRSDRITILLSVAALCATIVGTSCSTNARISDLNTSLNARIDDVNARIDDAVTSLNARIDSVVGGLNARIDDLHQDVRELRAIVIDALKTAD